MLARRNFDNYRAYHYFIYANCSYDKPACTKILSMTRRDSLIEVKYWEIFLRAYAHLLPVGHLTYNKMLVTSIKRL